MPVSGCFVVVGFSVVCSGVVVSSFPASFAAFARALFTASIIPFELNVAPDTVSTFVPCFFIISGISPFALPINASSSSDSVTIIYCILSFSITTPTVMSPLNPSPVP